MEERTMTSSGVAGAQACVELLGGTLRVPHEHILACVYPKAGDVVVAAGSLVEGVGNRFSDVDIYVFTDQLRRGSDVSLEAHHRVVDVNKEIVRHGMSDREIFVMHTVVPGTAHKIDVEFRVFGAVDELATWMRDLFSYAAANLVLFS